MRQLRNLLLMVVGIPLLAGAVGDGLLWKFERTWQSELARAYPEVDGARRAAFTLSKACRTPELAGPLHDLCGAFREQRLMIAGAVGAAALGLAMLFAIWVIGRVAARRRRLLLYTFVPGLHVTNLAVIVLIAVNACLAVAAIYFAETALFQAIHPMLLAGVGLGGILGVVAVARASFGLVKPVETAARGAPVSRERCPTLWGEVEGACRALGTAAPDHVVVGLEPNFFVTEVPVRTFDERVTGRTLYVSLTLARILTVEELRSVLGHELGHFVGEDTQFSRKFYPVYRGTTLALDGLGHAGSTTTSAAVAVIPAIAVLGFFHEAFARAESAVSRDRELAADRVGARLSGQAAAAAALVKVHAFADEWGTVCDRVLDVVQEDRAFRNLAAEFGDLVLRNVAPSRLVQLDDRRLPHPTDSHPPLAARLENLGESVASVEQRALDVAPGDPAVGLVDDHLRLEEELSAAEQALIAREHGLELSGDAPEPERATGT
ncbi:M48 family metallopeptidase [Anaeromyxobacter oryzisoli]|uniref:M48 family metallopeptidase n=1 Tax=Anaeromyxobacter oryzisoli TaxID=2925408 RepID=UPI001F5AEC39|nr:M48 family metallopeptidase [Anaeromyxobacter sp. SG63]